MDEQEIEGTFDTPETAANVAGALNQWFSWIVEGDKEEVPEVFEDFGISTEEYALDRDSDVEWEEIPSADASGNIVVVRIEGTQSLDLLQELIEALGAYEVNLNEDAVRDAGDDDDDDDDDEAGSDNDDDLGDDD